MLLQAALNGPHTTTDHPAVPESVDALVRDAVACVGAGARGVHLHPRDPSGRESLEPAVVDEVVHRVREACGVPVGVTTGAWIEASASWRVSLVKGWRAPDYASVNVSEEGWLEVARALLGAGVGVEAGVWTVEDAHALAASGLAGELTRVLVEPVGVPRQEAVTLVDAIHAALDAGGVVAPRLQHGDGDATWVLLQDAVRRGLDTRVGLEDTLRLPDGTPARENAALVAAARALGAGG
ncbi:MAG: 3-keto-5-aminohexanoate cleavage protein [Oryzihumus sp.]